MQPVRTPPVDSEDLAVAAAAVSRGQLVVIPTDTVYGVAADPRDAAATGRVFAAKRRPRRLALPVLVAEPAQALRLAARPDPRVAALMEAFWPGPLTVVVPANPGAGLHLGLADGTVALRQPDHPHPLALLRLTGPLAVTSANVSGRPPATTAAEAAEQLGRHVAHYVDAGPAPGGRPSTVVDCTGPEVRILRAGAVEADGIGQVLADQERAAR
jgi:tRNA threonylcarbamoyl adenosine modification protein (Sua5/YciO/YrdC/YwlC family)